MSIDLATDLIQELASAGILSAAQVAMVERALQKHPDVSPSELGTQLVKKELATRFQVDEVLSGRAARLVRGKYILRDKIRAGPMGVVYRALHPDLGIDVVLKELPAAVLATDSALERFRREVRTLAQFRHPRIIRVYDASLDSSPPFLVMEHVAGVNLQELIEKQGPLPLPQALRLITAAAEALEAVHEQGVVHRDVKPSNLMVSKGGELKLIDFGLARLQAQAQADAQHHDLSGAFLIGTPDYMSPEQCGGGNQVDQRADIYSLGCTLLYLVSGAPPLPEGTLADKIAWHQTGVIPALSNWATHAPAALDDVFQKMLARDAAQRWPNCAALRRALEQVVEQLAIEPDETIPIGELIDEEPTTAAGETQATAEVTPAQGPLVFSLDSSAKQPLAARPQRRAAGNAWLIGGLLGLGLIVLVGLIVWSASAPRESTKPVAGKIKKHKPNGDLKVVEQDRTFQFEIGPHNLVPDLAAGGSSGRVTKPPVQLPDEQIPPGVRWNPVVTTKLDPLFLKKCQRGVGRLLYSEIDTAIEQDCDGEWFVGNELTKDRAYWHLVLNDGVVTVSPLSSEDARDAELNGKSVRRSIDSTWEMRSQPLLDIESADLEIMFQPDGLQRVTVSLLCKKRNEVVFDTTQFSFDYEVNSDESVIHTITEMSNLEWTSPPSGWQRVEFVLPPERALEPGAKIRLSLTAFVFQPRPSYYRICKPYEFNWKPAAGTLPPKK